MPNTNERNIRIDEAAKVGREKMTDELSLEHRIDQGGHHVTGQQLGNVGVSDGTDENPMGQPPLTEQEKRNRGLSSAPSGGEADTRASTGEGPRPSEPARNEKVNPGEDFSTRVSRPSSSSARNDQRESRPNHP